MAAGAALGLCLLAVGGAVIHAIRHPHRGLPDRLAGTWLVLRSAAS